MEHNWAGLIRRFLDLMLNKLIRVPHPVLQNTNKITRAIKAVFSK